MGVHLWWLYLRLVVYMPRTVRRGSDVNISTPCAAQSRLLLLVGIAMGQLTPVHDMRHVPRGPMAPCHAHAHAQPHAPCLSFLVSRYLNPGKGNVSKGERQFLDGYRGDIYSTPELIPPWLWGGVKYSPSPPSPPSPSRGLPAAPVPALVPVRMDRAKANAKDHARGRPRPRTRRYSRHPRLNFRGVASSPVPGSDTHTSGFDHASSYAEPEPYRLHGIVSLLGLPAHPTAGLCRPLLRVQYALSCGRRADSPGQ